MEQGVSITILREIKECILPLSDEEFSMLEQHILHDGCRDSLVVWQRPDSEIVLVDGHNRLKICQKHNLPYKIKRVNFIDLQEAIRWIVDNQVTHRDLNRDQLSYCRGIKYLSMKKAIEGTVLSVGQNQYTAAEVLAEQFKVSESTIKRDAKFAEGLNMIGESNPALKIQILSGSSKIKKEDVQILMAYKGPVALTIKDEADLFDRTKKLRDQILDEVESKIKAIQHKQVRQAQPVLMDKEPVSMERSARLNKIRVMIVSAIEKAIDESDVDATKELKKLMDKLEYELFEN